MGHNGYGVPTPLDIAYQPTEPEEQRTNPHTIAYHLPSLQILDFVPIGAEPNSQRPLHLHLGAEKKPYVLANITASAVVPLIVLATAIGELGNETMLNSTG